MRIAVAQTVPVRGDVKANIAEHLRLADQAEGADVVVFPELSLTGYELDLAEELAFTENDPRLGPLMNTGKTLIVGAPVRLASGLHIGAFILSHSIDLYTKQHLGTFGPSAAVDGIVPPGEPAFFQPGTRDPLLDFGGTHAAVAICADTGRPSHPKAAAERGARVYLASVFVIPSEFERDAAAVRNYAIEHSMTVGFANYGGPTGGLASAGRSTIWSPEGDVLAQLPATGAGVAVAPR